MRERHHNTGTGRHAANTVTEISEWDDRDQQRLETLEGDQALAGFRGDGFYFWDETEACAMGPYETKEAAIASRDRYYEGLGNAHIDKALMGNAFFHIPTGTWMDPTKVTLQTPTKGETDDQSN